MRIKAYKPFVGAGMQAILAVRVNFIFWTIGNLFLSFVLFYLWKAVFSYGQGNINGFSLFDMTAYLFISNITSMLVGTEASYTVGEEILDGSISMRLIKPVSYNLSLIATELGITILKFFMIVLPVVAGVEIYRYVQSGTLLFSPINFAFYILSAGLSYIILFYFNLCFGFLAFALKNLWGCNRLKDGIVNFLSGGLIPLAFFPLWARNIFDFLPFASMNYTPVMIYLGKTQGMELLQAFGIQFFWALFFYGLSKLIWKLTINQLTVQGG